MIIPDKLQSSKETESFSNNLELYSMESIIALTENPLSIDIEKNTSIEILESVIVIKKE